MKTERELFQKEYCKVQMITDKGDTFEQLPNGDYVRCSLQLAWLMWQASAQREGYKFVPVEPTRKMEMAGMNAGAGFVSKSIYKAMIGAAP